MLRPRESHELKLRSSQITVTPDAILTWAHDVFGNAVATATFQMSATNLVIASAAVLQLDAVAWPVFDIAFSAMSYPFRYSDDDWIDLGALAVPQFADDAGVLQTWAQMFVRGTRTETLSLLKDLSFGVSEAVQYQTREEEGAQTPVETLNRGWGSCRDFCGAVHRSSAHARIRCQDRFRLSLQPEPTKRGVKRYRINPCVGGGLRTGSRLDYVRPHESRRRWV
jgi:Bacterial transglutaminase-like N-terminal region